MLKIFAKDIEAHLDEEKGVISYFKLGNHELFSLSSPIFVARLRNESGECFYIDSTNGKVVSNGSQGFVYSNFEAPFSLVSVKVTWVADTSVSWQIEVDQIPKEYALEWVEFPKICLPRLIDNDPNGGRILFPYDEGILLTDETSLPRYEPEFPMSGAYFIFPNKVCSQFISYLFDDIGLYFGAHDTDRAFKGIDFFPYNDGVAICTRLYSGADFGEGYKQNYPIVWQACKGNWKDACDIYRAWFEKNLPSGVIKTKENESLPSWYENMPLVVTYPVRGIHDMDKMEPNSLFPYTNALPIFDEIKSRTGCQIMSLLMHWEGTAPWAPPYVWPPYGGVNLFNEFRDKLHKNGDLLGVYCSGFGYTSKSTLIESYNCEEKIKNENVLEGVCHSPANKPELGITCTPYQRYGYDICPASKRGQELLNEGFAPVFKSGVDYAQILDQNHGGGQYMCYARGHNHPPMPGAWMTSNMQELLKSWKKTASGMLFGCESTASEPFIGSLQMSDNRFELGYPYGTPIPVFAYIYHEYLRNFMGNQCGCPFEPTVDTLRYRLAYSFSIGDMMTLILSPKGGLMSHWGTHDFSQPPSWEKALTFIKNMMDFYNNGAKKYLYCGKMTNAPDIECENITIPMFRGRPSITLPRLLFSTWEADGGKTAYIVVNPEDKAVNFKLNGKEYSVDALNAILITI